MGGLLFAFARFASFASLAGNSVFVPTAARSAVGIHRIGEKFDA